MKRFLEVMRRLALTVTTTAALLSTDLLVARADAMVLGSPASIRAVMDSLNVTENAQYFYGGRDYCWYPYGWNGPGWYWCGYAYRRGFGWGGGTAGTVGAPEEVTPGGTWVAEAMDDIWEAADVVPVVRVDPADPASAVEAEDLGVAVLPWAAVDPGDGVDECHFRRRRPGIASRHCS